MDRNDTFCLCDFFFITGADEVVIKYAIEDTDDEVAAESFLIEAFKNNQAERLTDDSLETDIFMSHDGETALSEVAKLGTKWKPNVGREIS